MVLLVLPVEAGFGSCYYFAEKAFLDRENKEHHRWARLAKIVTGWAAHLFYWVYPGVMVAMMATLLSYMWTAMGGADLSLTVKCVICAVFSGPPHKGKCFHLVEARVLEARHKGVIRHVAEQRHARAGQLGSPGRLPGPFQLNQEQARDGRTRARFPRCRWRRLRWRSGNSLVAQPDRFVLSRNGKRKEKTDCSRNEQALRNPFLIHAHTLAAKRGRDK